MQEISDFGVYPTHTPLINSGPVPDVERVRSAGFVQPTQLSLAVTWSVENPGPGTEDLLLNINICDFKEVI